jgi:aryl-alcohol dehydrogenase-like predicted oxidoreductase
MRHTTFGSTDLHVSRVCLGTWQFGGEWGEVDEGAAKDAVVTALNLGINLFDTAQAYGWGKAERLLGEALAPVVERDRGRVVLATKGGLRMTDRGLARDSSPAWLRRGVEESLEHLGTDYLDLYQVHWPDPDTPFEVTAQALQELADEGLIRHVGVSNFDVDQLRAFQRTRRIDGYQPAYHLFRRGIEDQELPYCRDHGIGVLVYGPLAHGLLTGRFHLDRELPTGDWRRRSDVFRDEVVRQNAGVVERLRHFADEEVGCSLVQLAIAWTLHQPGVHVAIVGTRNPAHVQGAAKASEVDLTDEHLRGIDRIVREAAPMGGPAPEAG